ncbi:MAG TPA: hypothetical protein VGO47_00635 [Chlamydiales bacterium]|jgi:hypothetical protein|nr:hypothetical protein [Chlamydiales bacterium]
MTVVSVGKSGPMVVNPLCNTYPLRRAEEAERGVPIPQYVLRSVQDAFVCNAQKIQDVNEKLRALRNKVVQTQDCFSSTKNSGMLIEKNKAEKTWSLFPKLDASGWDCLAKFAAFGVLATAQTTLAVCKLTHSVADQIAPRMSAPVSNNRRADQLNSLKPGSETMPPAKRVLQKENCVAPAPMTPMPMGHTEELNKAGTPGLMRVKVTVTSPVLTPFQLNISVPAN